MMWSRWFRVPLVVVLAVALTVAGLPPGAEPARAAAGDAVVLEAPTLVHSSGAELRWSRFAGPSVFDRYEVHRGTRAGFAPSSSTLLATVRDVDTTTWVDTTAAPSPSATETKSFWYKVVVNGTDASNEQTVAMPLDGQATLTLQPGPSEGLGTYVATSLNSTVLCVSYLNFGGAAPLRIGNFSGTYQYRYRSLLRFDLRRIPPGAQVSSAKLTLWHLSTAPPDEVDLYRVTRAWEEGRAGSSGACDGSGADWKEARAGVAWSSLSAPDAGGGDFDSAKPVLATRDLTSPAHDSFTLTDLVRGWVGAPARTWGCC